MYIDYVNIMRHMRIDKVMSVTVSTVLFQCLKKTSIRTPCGVINTFKND